MEAILSGHLISTGPAELLIASIWQGLLLTALAWAALRLASGLRASTRFTLWMIVFVLVALLPCFALARGFFGNSAGLPSQAPQTYAFYLNGAWALALEVVWAFASLFSLGRLFLSVRQMRALLRNSIPVPFAELAEEIQPVVMRNGKRPVEIRLSEAVDAPSVIGFFRPAVVVPRSLWNELSPADMKQVIQHEMAHLDRRDDWTNLLQKLLRAASPLNPALLWAERHLCREREQACDDAVLDAAGNARAYATCLTKLAENKLMRQVTSLAPGFWQRHSELAGRVENILHRRRNLRPVFSGGLVAAALVAALSGVLALQRVPGLVSFADPEPLAATFTPAPIGRIHPDLSRAHYQEAVFHPAVSQTGVRASVLPKVHTARPVRSTRQLQFVQVTEDQDGGSMTLVLFTVEVPQKSQASHGVLLQPLPTPDSWIGFQI
jgi:bla regulator protein blaR1